jgi:hypothetical protein
MQVKTYEEMRDFIQCGDLFEFGGNSLIGKAIRFFTKQQVNHSALGMSINEYSNHAGNRKFVLEADPDGIVLNTASKSVQDCLKSGGVVFWYPLAAIHDYKRNMVADWALQMVGTKYDFGSLFKNAISKVNASVRKLFCSEFVFISLVSAGIFLNYKLVDGKVVDMSGQPVKAPRPGEFEQYGCYGDPVQIVL